MYNTFLKGISRHTYMKMFFLIIVFGMTQLSIVVVTATPPTTGDSFSYNLSRSVSNGAGAYNGYTDQLTSKGNYIITTSSQTLVQIHASYVWTYTSSEGTDQTGNINRNVAFSLDTRKYTSSQTDLDEYDTLNATNLYVWFWIDPHQSFTIGSTIKILDQTFKVTNLGATIWSNGLPKNAIELQYSGNGQRNDAYGVFSYTYTDIYYYDKTSGYVIAERYTEHDSGTWQGQYATFDLMQSLDVVGSSYYIPIDYFTLLIDSMIVLAIVIGSIGFSVFVYRKYRWRSRYPDSETHGIVQVFRIKSTSSIRGLKYELTDHFNNFIEDFIERALITKDRVANDVTYKKLLGLEINNKESKIGLILCKDTDITEALRGYIGIKDFFSEVRAKIPDRVIREAHYDGLSLPTNVMYNVFDTYQVLLLETLQDISYDPQLITRMQKSDLPVVTTIAETVYGVKSKQWIYAQFTSGDIGYVAKIKSQIVGFAFASDINGYGRLHTLTVLPEYRNRGIGKELMRARLKALYELEVHNVITEIADWNLASLRIAFIHGFKHIGNMYVETIRTERIKKSIVRR